MYLDIKHASSLNSAIAVQSGSALDNRNGSNYGFMQWFVTGGANASALIDVMVASQATLYVTAQSITAANGFGSAQIAAYWPWVRADVRARFVGATATFIIAPGLK